MQIFVFNRKNETWNTNGAVAIVAESRVAAEALYRREFKFDFEVEELEITEGLMLVADGYDSTEMVVRHLTMRAADETYCACKDEAFINDDTPGKCGNCGKPFRR